MIQNGARFCHLNRLSCFGQVDGLATMESTLQSWLSLAPEGSFTCRFLHDSDLLHAKIVHEADDLYRAETKKSHRFWAADLLNV
jgi:phosphoribosyl-ATP pyrophosphohydrolase/phosphoribosyl-AMP cyclohydrolase/histidinol dehydrogenase